MNTHVRTCILLPTVKIKTISVNILGIVVPYKRVRFKPACAYNYTVLHGIFHNDCMERKRITYWIGVNTIFLVLTNACTPSSTVTDSKAFIKTQGSSHSLPKEHLKV